MSTNHRPLSDYLTVNELPSNFRSYGNRNKIYIRGLTFGESLALAKYTSNDSVTNYSQLYPIYKDVIRFDDDYDIKNLELIDFIICMIISSIYSVDDFGWSPNIHCSNLNDDGTECSGVITEKIVLDDFSFDPPNIEDLPIPLINNNQTINIGAVTLKDIMDKESYLIDHPDTPSELISYAITIKSIDDKDDISLEDKIEFISSSRLSFIHDIDKIFKDLSIKINYIEKVCPVCGKVNRLKVGLNQLRSYPRI